MNIYKYIGEKIKTIREHAGMSQKEFANKSGLSLYKLKRIEEGKHKITFITLWIICEVLNIKVSDLFTNIESRIKCKQM